MRKRFFDDRVFYDTKNDKIWIGRPDSKTNNEPWDWFFRTDGMVLRNTKKIPKYFKEISREPEYSLC